MQVHKPTNVKFMAAYPRYEPVIIDSTSIMTYKACPLKYFYRMVLGMAARGEAAPYFPFGSAYHKFREVLERCAATGDTEGAAFVSALAVAMDYGEKHLPKNIQGKWSFLTLGRLKESCGIAFKHWMLERQAGRIKVLQFEQPFALQMKDGKIRAGRADQIVAWAGKNWGRDFKTTSMEQGGKVSPYYKRQLEPNDQFTGYTWGEGKLVGTEIQGQIIEVLLNTAKVGPLIETFTTTRTKGQIERWERDTAFWHSMIDKSREEDHYPMNEKHCFQCEYHSVCLAPSESGQMSQLKSYFKLEPWDCTNVPD